MTKTQRQNNIFDYLQHGNVAREELAKIAAQLASLFNHFKKTNYFDLTKSDRQAIAKLLKISKTEKVNGQIECPAYSWDGLHYDFSEKSDQELRYEGNFTWEIED